MSNKATIIITAHNKPGLFMESLKSVIEQTYSSIEIIACFDPDETGFKEILDELKNYASKMIRSYDLCMIFEDVHQQSFTPGMMQKF